MAHKKHQPITEKEIAEIFRRLKQGQSTQKIANDLNISLITIQNKKNYLLRMGEINGVLRPKKISRDEIYNFLEQGYKQTEIAKKLGVSRQYVHQIKNEVMLSI